MLPLVGGAVDPGTLYHVQSTQGAVPSPQPLANVKFSDWGLETWNLSQPVPSFVCPPRPPSLLLPWRRCD